MHNIALTIVIIMTGMLLGKEIYIEVRIELSNFMVQMTLVIFVIGWQAWSTSLIFMIFLCM